MPAPEALIVEEPMAPVSVTLEPGTMLLGRYRVGSVLGRGGFGITYRVTDTRLGREVAVKELFPLDALRHGHEVAVAPERRRAFDEARQRFQREAASLARFNHPGIVQIFEVFEANGTAYLVMELIEGVPIGELLRRRGAPLSVAETLDVMLRVGGALGAVHAAGMLHRDVNPSNIMIDGSTRIVLIDFGLARRFGDDISGQLTRAVTPGYAPPEQYAGSTASGPPCDVFGLAATAYKLLTGVTPANVIDRQAGGELVAPRNLRDDIPALVSAAILDGMELDPGHRPVSTEAFLHRLGLFGTLPGAELALDLAAAGPSVQERPVAATPVAVPAGVPATGVVPGPARVEAPVARPAPVVVAPPSPDPVGAPAQPFAPWHDGAPPVVGPPSRRRGWLTWPVGIAATAMASASPLVVVAVVAYVAIPALATYGDLVVSRHRAHHAALRRRWDDMSPMVFLPARFARNLVVGAARSIPAVAVAAIGVATHDVLADGSVGPVVLDMAVRVTGIAMALVLVLPLRDSGRGFRASIGIDACVTRAGDASRTAVVWVVAVALTAVAALLRPEMWPLG